MNMVKKIIAGIMIMLIVISGCGKEINNNYQYEKSNDEQEIKNIDYRDSMREFVKKISNYSKAKKEQFIVIQQNAEDILPSEEEKRNEYLEVIDGIGREDVNYGYDKDNKETDKDVKEEMIKHLNLFRDSGKKVLAVDYCYDKEKMLKSYEDNEDYGYISFAADERNLNNIPEFPESIYNENSSDIETLDDAKNFLYLINPENYDDKKKFINAINDTNYDVVIIDAFFNSAIEQYPLPPRRSRAALGLSIRAVPLWAGKPSARQAPAFSGSHAVSRHNRYTGGRSSDRRKRPRRSVPRPG